MRNERFERDDAKAIDNFEKHDVSFEDAVSAVDDTCAVDDVDDTMDYGEERYRIIGMANGRLLAVFYTYRGSRLRIISARKATRKEHGEYARQNPQT